MIRVGVVDDQYLIREGLTSILQSSKDIDVVYQGADGVEFVDAIRAGVVMDVALVDIRMPHMDGLQAARLVSQFESAPAIVMLTTFADSEYVMQALESGAVGFMLKRSNRAELIAAVRAAAIGDAMLSAEVTKAVIERMLNRPRVDNSTDSDLSRLTQREMDVLQHIGAGATNAEIARSLHLSESTIKTHVSNILSKTGSRDRVAVALLAIRAGRTRTHPPDGGA